MKEIKTLQQAIRYFSDEQVCIDTVAAMRWPDGKPVCPACEHTEHYYLKTQKRWKCKECNRQFSVKLNTIFEDSPLPLDKWLTAMWLLANCKNGISSYEVARSIGITQKSAWHMMHRIRLAMKDDGSQIGGGYKDPSATEVDETFIGGKVRNMHKARRLKLQSQKIVGLKNETKTIVVGMLDRANGKVRAELAAVRDRKTLNSIVREHVKFGSAIYTDDHMGYDELYKHFFHTAINKQAEGYVRGKVHTQGIENFWSLLKRGLSGTYVAVEPYHLSRYLDEQMFRFNTRKVGERKIGDAERFTTVLSQVTGRRLTYAEATGKVGETTA